MVMRVSLQKCVWSCVLLCSLSAKSGRAQIFFDPAAFSLGSRGALSHALEAGPKFPRFFVSTPPPPPPAPTDAAAPAPASTTAANEAPPTSGAADPAILDTLQGISSLEDTGALIDPLQEPLAGRRSKHSKGIAAPLTPAPDLAAPDGGPTPGQGPSAGPAAAPAVAPGLNSSVNGSTPSHPTQIKDLLMPAPPAPPLQAPKLPGPVPAQAPPAQVGHGQPQAGSNDASQGNCEQQGLQGSCNGCICCCLPKGSGGFTSYRPQDCECQKVVQSSDVWLTLTMSVILLLPALLVSFWFAGLYPASPYRARAVM